jgi:hypothetical protein
MVQYSIDAGNPAPARHTDTDAAGEMEKTRAVLAEKAAVQNDLLQARREQAAVHLDRINTEAERAAQDYQQAWENGDSSKMVESQREIAALEVRRHNTQAVAEHLDRTPPVPADPVEAFISRCEPKTAAWMRAHPDDARILATDPTSRRAAKLMAADNDAKSEGYVAGSADYFEHVETFLGLKDGGAGRRRSSNDSGTLRVRVTSDPNKTLAPGEVRMSPGEFKAATETLVWNYDSGEHKKGEPLGVKEYLRRQNLMKQQGGYYDKLD